MSFLPFAISTDSLRIIAIVIFLAVSLVYIYARSWSGYWTVTIRNYFIIITVIIIGTTSILKTGVIDFHSIMSTFGIMVPAVLVMALLGQWIGSIMDNPKNREDADYKLSVLNALKSIDKNMTLEDLNEKLTKTIEEPDSPEEPTEEESEG